MYFREPHEPTVRERDFVGALLQTAAFIISRHQGIEENARPEAVLRSGGE